MTTLERNAGEETAGAGTHKVARTPLPKLQLGIIFLTQIAEPITATVIYPFVNQFVRETGITGGDETKTGYYAGLVESTFFFSEAATVFAWGWLSDQIGRKPVLILGPLGLSMAMLGFGLSKTFWPLVFFRAMQGCFNGNIGVSKSVVAEITDSTNIGDAYALVPMMWVSGATIGPMLGGVLSNPAARWTETFGKIPFFYQYPYFLPCAAASSLAFLSFIVSSIALKETLPSTSRKLGFKGAWGWLVNKALRIPVNSALDEDDMTAALLPNADSIHYGTTGMESAVPQVPAEATPPLSDLFTPDYITTVLNYGLFNFFEMAISALIPLAYSTPIGYGGLGMDPFRIGVLMGTFGMVNGLLSAFATGPAIRRFGPTKVFQNAILLLFVSAGGIDARVSCVILTQFIIQTIAVSPCYASMGVLVVQVCPNKLLLGSANGGAQMVGSASRALAPFIASSLFAVSIQRNWAGGYAVFYLFFALLVMLVSTSRYLPHSGGRGS
ncbi:major facilitator superfamily domain-containing protein [Ephemerocybe angulata]|uniref:Major facilitator superfamily domain-containing protein n=1 Tax=Ephemerocybe angulata TaxID=980116 RepID=A0A8H6MDB3_9AGAR|nr:major facilitator superfamily domain-containing protein [Tulosesus angulatus]